MQFPRISKCRLYIDEVGNHDLRASRENENNRYLSLTGLIISLDYVRDFLHPALESLKRRYFGEHPDDPIILHRRELVNQRPPFEVLRDPNMRAAFDLEILALVRDASFMVITAVIDKWEHVDRYRVWQDDPYHYCLRVMLERYVMELQSRGARGDVLAESRGGKEDRRLKEEFQRVYVGGANVGHAAFVERLTSSQLKLKPKSANIAGLQLADMIAHPSFIATKARHEGKPLPTNFGGQIATILEATKYRHRADGTIEGYGRKWLP